MFALDRRLWPSNAACVALRLDFWWWPVIKALDNLQLSARLVLGLYRLSYGARTGTLLALAALQWSQVIRRDVLRSQHTDLKSWR